MSLFMLPHAVQAADPPPNIVIIFADDWGCYAGAYARCEGPTSVHTLLNTPHIDRLAQEGVLFRYAFVPSPSCTPCRSALMTGRHFWQTGRASILRGAVWDDQLPAFPLLLHRAGYHIGETYKVWGPGEPHDAPFGAGQHRFERRGTRFNQFSQTVTAQMERGVPRETAINQLLAEVRGNFDDFMNARPAGQPFCYWLGPTNTHRPWVRGSGKQIWGLNPDHLQGKLPRFLPDVPEIREDFCDYLGEIMALDAAVGVIVQRLEELGERERTLIILSGDHGPPGFGRGKCNLYDFGTRVPLIISGPGVVRGMIVEELVSLVDLAPTLYAFAGVSPPADLAGRSLQPWLTNSSPPRPSPTRAVFSGRERHVEDAREGYLPYPQRAIRTSNYLYIVNFRPERWPLGDPKHHGSALGQPEREALSTNTRLTLADDDASPTKAWLVLHADDPQFSNYYQLIYGKRPSEELYDLSRDPDQLQNLAENTDYTKIKTELRAKLWDELTRTSDPRLIDDGRYYETPPLAGPLPSSANLKSKKR